MSVSNVVSLRPPFEAGGLSTKGLSRGASEPRELRLPILATANDVREVVQYLKKRPDGVTLSEVAQPLKKRIFYPPKVDAYEEWGLIKRSRGRLMLTPLGWEFARSLEPEAWSYRSLLDAAPAYREALCWIQREDLEVVTEYDLAEYWEGYLPAPFARDNKGGLENGAVCFFHLCQAAELGTMTIGKRGQPARLRILRAELQRHLQPRATGDLRMLPAPGADGHTVSAAHAAPSSTARITAQTKLKSFRVYISCRGMSPVIAHLRKMLAVFDIASEVDDRSAADHTPAAAAEMAECCQAAIIVITGEDNRAEPPAAPLLTSELLGEIGVAFVYYEKRVVLLWDEAVSVPENLQGLRRCRFKGDMLTWDSGIELIRALLQELPQSY